jgi:hypothetical protein
VITANLVQGNTLSCGCYRRTLLRQRLKAVRDAGRVKVGAGMLRFE